MGTTTRRRHGRGLFFMLVTTWVVASTLTLSHPVAGAHALSANEPEATSPASGPQSPSPVRAEPPQDVHERRGILPPWHENWIPELRNQPGRPTRKTTVLLVQPGTPESSLA